MDERRNQQQRVAITAPFFRVWLCGAFRVERCVGEGYEVLRPAEWGGSNYPRQLLKALLCCPGRQARREALLELLWPDASFELAVISLNTATTKLRATLRPAKGQESLLLTEQEAKHYLLPGQQLLWVDADAALSLLTQAERLERTSSDTLALLEEAEGYFRRGLFQQEEEGQWIAGRRATVEQARYQGRLWLVDAYEQQGMPGQAATTLSLMLEEDPLDEDILCRLMVLLHRQGMTHQALRQYQSLCDALASEGLEPTEATRELAMRMQHRRSTPFVSRDVMHLFPPLEEPSSSPTIGFDTQKQHEASTDLPGDSHQTVPHMISISPQTRAIETIFAAYEKVPTSLFHLQDINHSEVSAHAQNTREQHLSAWLLLGAGSLAPLFDAGWSREDVFHSIDLLLKVVQVMPKDAQHYSRRQLLQLGAAAMLSDIPIPDGKHISEEERTALCQAFSESIIAGWKLVQTRGSHQILATSKAQLYLLQQCHLHSSIYPTLYSGVYRLIGAALHFQGRYQEAYKEHEKAYYTALESADVWNMAQCRAWQADGLKEQKQYKESLQVTDAALRLISTCTGTEIIRTRAHLLASSAETAASSGDEREAKSRLDASANLMTAISAPHEEFDQTSWHQIAGACALILGQHEVAVRELQKALHELPIQWSLRHATTLMPLTIVYARMKEKELCLEYAEKSIKVIGGLNSPGLRHQFVYYMQQELSQAFLRDPQVETFISNLPRVFSVK